MAIDRRGGHGYFIPVLLAAQLPPLMQLGRLAEAIALGEEAVEAAWTSGDPALRLGAHSDLALALHLAGDRDGAEREAHEAVRLSRRRAPVASTSGLDARPHPGRRDPEAGIATMLEAAGGRELPDVASRRAPVRLGRPGRRRAARGDLPAAERAAARLDAAAAAIGTPLARALAARTRAAVLLAQGRPGEAAAAAARGAAVRSAPLEAARARALEGVALARAGDRARGVAALKQAADDLERFGAQRLRDEAARELRRLGVRTWRRGPAAARGAEGLDALSAREREVAELVLAGQRNADIAQRALPQPQDRREPHPQHLRQAWRRLARRTRGALRGRAAAIGAAIRSLALKTRRCMHG